MKDYFYKVIIEPCDEGGFTATVPALPGCVSESETYEETVENIKDAIKLYVETVQEREHKVILDETHVTEMCISV